LKNVASVFTVEELAFIKEHTGILLSDEIDYTDDDLFIIESAISDNAPDGNVLERIMDKFYDYLDD